MERRCILNLMEAVLKAKSGDSILTDNRMLRVGTCGSIVDGVTDMLATLYKIDFEADWTIIPATNPRVYMDFAGAWNAMMNGKFGHIEGDGGIYCVGWIEGRPVLCVYSVGDGPPHEVNPTAEMSKSTRWYVEESDVAS